MRIVIEKLREDGSVHWTSHADIPEQEGETDEWPPVALIIEWWKQPSVVHAYRITNGMRGPLMVKVSDQKGAPALDAFEVSPGGTITTRRHGLLR